MLLVLSLHVLRDTRGIVVRHIAEGTRRQLLARAVMIQSEQFYGFVIRTAGTHCFCMWMVRAPF